MNITEWIWNMNELLFIKFSRATMLYWWSDDRFGYYWMVLYLANEAMIVQFRWRIIKDYWAGVLGWMRYSSIRFVLDQFCTQRFTTSAPLLYLIVASKGLYSQGHYIIAGSNGIVSYFIGIVRSGQDILIVMLGLLCLHV